MEKISYFVLRKCCPVCKSVQKNVLYSCSFSEPPISDYLEEFYSPQGGVEFEYLSGSNFILDECKDCGLIYQRFIPNDFLMTKLYEEWIDPKKVFDSRVKKRDVRYYARLSREIEMCIQYFNVQPSKLEFFDFGMGWGEWCLMAKAFGLSVFGTELSKSRIDYANTNGVSTISWEKIQDYMFDFINTEQVFA